MRWTYCVIVWALAGCVVNQPNADPLEPPADAGAPDTEQRADAGAPDGGDALPPPPNNPHPPVDCEIEPRWINPHTAPMYSRQTAHFGPGGALILRGDDFGSEVLRVRDGANASPHRASWERHLNRDWTRVAVIEQEGQQLRVSNVLTGEALTRIPVPTADGARLVHTLPAITPDGETALALDCWTRPDGGDGSLELRVIDVTSGEVTTLALGVGTGPSWGPLPLLVVSPDAAHVLVAGIGDDAVAMVDLERGTVQSAGNIFGPQSDQLLGEFQVRPPEAFGVIAATFSPDGKTVALVGPDGMLLQLDTTTLEAVADPIPIGLRVANGTSFLPSVESPVAYSPDGERLAHVAPDGQLVVSDAATGANLSVLTVELPPGDAQLGESPATPMAASWTDAGLFVAFEAGTALWSCAPPSAPGPPLEVEIEGPAEVDDGQLLHFTVTVTGAQGPAVRHVSFAGGRGAALGEAVAAWPSEAGELVVRAEADDGRSSGWAEISVWVRPGE